MKRVKTVVNLFQSTRSPSYLLFAFKYLTTKAFNVMDDAVFTWEQKSDPHNLIFILGLYKVYILIPTNRLNRI